MLSILPPPGLDIFFILLYSNSMTTASYIRLWCARRGGSGFVYGAFFVHILAE